ncbi:MAG: hypothetical protein KDA38_08885 [Planctomycetales bacterium]|nr:hypothetical protein [Planctomycetales bacterium]
MNFTPDITIFWGKTSQNLAHVFVRVAGLPSDARLSGFVHGPVCRYSRTLPSRIMLRDLGPGNERLLRAAIPDPCFWSPALPFLYDAELQVETDAAEPVALRQSFGVRMFGASGRSLRLEGKRWVARGTRWPAASETHTPNRDGGPSLAEAIAALHDESLVAVVTDPSPAVCREASEAGVMLLVSVANNHAAFEHQVAELARWPGVAMIAVPAAYDVNVSDRVGALRGRFPNLLFAATMAASERDSGAMPIDWADAVIADIGPAACSEQETATWLAELGRANRPVLVSRHEPALESQSDAVADEPAELFLDARAACDRLQADTAEFGDFAGYLIDGTPFGSGRR